MQIILYVFTLYMQICVILSLLSYSFLSVFLFFIFCSLCCEYELLLVIFFLLNSMFCSVHLAKWAAIHFNTIRVDFYFFLPILYVYGICIIAIVELEHTTLNYFVCIKVPRIYMHTQWTSYYTLQWTKKKSTKRKEDEKHVEEE